MKTLLLLLVVSLGALAGCHNTWQGVKTDGTQIISRSVSGIGQGIGKAGAALERTGESIDNSLHQSPAPVYRAEESTPN